MSNTAVHLVAEVLPEVPIRHWVCTFPWGVRAVLGYDKDLCRAAVSAFAGELSRWQKRQAKKLLGLGSMQQALTGSVAVVQRTDSAIRLLRHVFRADVETCPRCGGPMRWVEAATEQGAIARLLAKHRLAPKPAPERRAPAASGQLPLPFG